MVAFTEEMVDVGGTKVHTLKGGSGEPLLLLHGAGGNTGWLKFADALADKYTVYYPSHPGYGKTDRPDWLETIPDMACFYTWYLESLGLEGVRTIGFSMGGWVASEITAMCNHSIGKLMLVGAAGVKPNDAEITDIFIISPAQVLNLMMELQQQFHLTYLFVAHDLSVIRHICDRVAVMYLGRIVEVGTAEQIFTSPQHPYTAALLAAVLEPAPATRGQFTVLAGEVPSPADPPPGCHFNPRCPHAEERCQAAWPNFESLNNDTHEAACVRLAELNQ